ncbi:sensor histidine kinase [Ferruginibacter sp. HRS2-29]|nr:sensor histidine kinase [Ferruginibacter sp. HRS2-29]
MSTRQFISMIVVLFVTGTLSLVFVQYNSSSNVNRLINGNSRLLKELRTSNHLREVERDIIWVESRIRAAIATDDISHLEGVDDKVEEVQNYLDTLITLSPDQKNIGYIKRLGVLIDKKKDTKDQLVTEYTSTGKMDNTIMISNPGARIISNEISQLTKKINDNRQLVMQQLTTSVERDARRAKLWNGAMIGLIVLLGSGWLWFIISRIRQQNSLIQQLDISEKKARESAAVKENFMANMSHEIRTPLNSILGFTNLLSQKKLDADSGKFVSSIQKAGENLLAIINDILDLSKIEAGMMRIEHTRFSVRGLFDSIRTLFHERAREKALALQLTIDPDVPDTLIGDATRLTQVLVNLIGNAIKFTAAGSIYIDVYVKNKIEQNIDLGIRITDTGIGIPKEKLTEVFDRFHQAEDSTTRNYGGTGLGLSIVKDLLDIQHGGISVESEPGTGTTFTLFIPYLISPEQLNEVAVTEDDRYKNISASSVKLLVVDDNEMNQSLMTHLLGNWGFQHEVVGNAATAIALLRQQPIDLVLMDIQMPEMDGYAATRFIRQEMGSDVPIVAMTAHALAGEKEKCLSFGMNDYLPKPIIEHQLYNAILKFTGKEKKPLVFSENIENAGYQFIHTGYLKDISKGNIVYEQKVTEQFLRLVPASLDKIGNAVSSGDIAALRAEAHDLKTTVSIMGLTEILQPVLDSIEQAADVNAAAAGIAALKNICANALPEAQHFFEGL